MGTIISIRNRKPGEIWAVIMSTGKKHQVASIYAQRNAAEADCAWRQQQVHSYTSFLQKSNQPIPHYSITPISRAELPKNWRPLPALGLLYGQS